VTLRVEGVGQRRLEGRVQFGDRGEAISRVLRRGLEDDALDGLGHCRAHTSRRRHRVVDVLDQDRHRRLGFEREPAGGHQIEDDAQGVLVASGIHRARLDLLR
jgi:hypothetical protein